MHTSMIASPRIRYVQAPLSDPRFLVSSSALISISLFAALFLTQGEVSALITLARILGGFAVAYFQVPWAARYGAIQTYGVEAAYGLSLR